MGEITYLEELSQIQLSPMELQGYPGPSGATAFMELIETLISIVLCFRATEKKKTASHFLLEISILGELVL